MPNAVEKLATGLAGKNFNESAWEALQALADEFPVWRYWNPQDAASRPAHAARAGRFYPTAVRFADVRGHGPENERNCRCTFLPVHRSEYEEMLADGSIQEFAEDGVAFFLEVKTNKKGKKYCTEKGKGIVPCPKGTKAAKKPAGKKPSAASVRKELAAIMQSGKATAAQKKALSAKLALLSKDEVAAIKKALGLKGKHDELAHGAHEHGKAAAQEAKEEAAYEKAFDKAWDKVISGKVTAAHLAELSTEDIKQMYQGLPKGQQKPTAKTRAGLIKELVQKAAGEWKEKPKKEAKPKKPAEPAVKKSIDAKLADAASGGTPISSHEILGAGLKKKDIEAAYKKLSGKPLPAYANTSKSAAVALAFEANLKGQKGGKKAAPVVQKAASKLVKQISSGTTPPHGLPADNEVRPGKDSGGYNKTHKNVVKPTGPDKLALQGYAGSGYHDINKALRTGKGTPAVKEAAQRVVDVIESQPILDEPVITYRGLSPHSPWGQQYIAQLLATPPGSVITQSGMMSTSHDSKTAIGSFGSAGGLVIEVAARQGVNVNAALGHGSPHKDEREFLLAHGAQFRVLGVKVVEYDFHGMKKKVRTLQVEQIFPGEPGWIDHPPQGATP